MIYPFQSVSHTQWVNKYTERKENIIMKKLFFILAIIFTILAIVFAWFIIRGNESINYVHVAIPTIFGALCVKNYRWYKKKEENEK